uniref:Uncharacterized protein n=1 Tax=Prolemur simus TaxID=1328070 RepID=A0A8C9DDP9_PROSS
MGHVVTYTPMAPGSYLIAIKYSGLQHIVPRWGSIHETSTVLVETVTKSSSSRGSSYSSIPKFCSDASKVVTQGPGLPQAFVGQKNSFTVDCSKAGTNMMMVGVHGPKTPFEEVSVKHLGSQVYNVTYTVKEKGDHILIMKWGDRTPQRTCLSPETIFLKPGENSAASSSFLFQLAGPGFPLSVTPAPGHRG